MRKQSELVDSEKFSLFCGLFLIELVLNDIMDFLNIRMTKIPLGPNLVTDHLLDFLHLGEATLGLAVKK